VRFVDLPVGDVDARWELELGLRFHEAVGERAGDGHELEDGAGLVGVLDGAVLLGFGSYEPVEPWRLMLL
jgi:hypothetical protein